MYNYKKIFKNAFFTVDFFTLFFLEKKSISSEITVVKIPETCADFSEFFL